jgi:hypothetical protein
MSLPSGAVLAHGEFDRIKKAVEELEKDSHAPRDLSAKIRIHVHHEYPKALYLGSKKSVVVQNAKEEQEARSKGFGARVEPREEEE